MTPSIFSNEDLIAALILAAADAGFDQGSINPHSSHPSRSGIDRFLHHRNLRFHDLKRELERRLNGQGVAM